MDTSSVELEKEREQLIAQYYKDYGQIAVNIDKSIAAMNQYIELSTEEVVIEVRS